MAEPDEYIIHRTLLRFPEGKKRSINIKKPVYDLEAYRKFLKETEGAINVDFVYETIPGECRRKIVIKI